MRAIFGLILSIFSYTSCAATDILLAEIYKEGIDPAAYLVSEKLDGVRGIWDGHTLRFRSGQEIKAPDWFIKALPTNALDGELWGGRGSFEKTSGSVRKTVPVDEEWRAVRYMIFELPEASGDFSVRAERIKQIVKQADLPWLHAIEQYHVKDAAELKQRMAAVVRTGGEGLMLHKADAPYVTGRSDVLLKLKPWLDAEARVIQHIPGKGKHTGRLGALLVETPTGQRFRLGTGFTDAQRAAPPGIDAHVTYRYRSLTVKGLPRHPVYLRQRTDEPESRP